MRKKGGGLHDLPASVEERPGNREDGGEGLLPPSVNLAIVLMRAFSVSKGRLDAYRVF